MSTNRRTRLAKALAQATTLTYQQALARLDARTAAGHPLPRTDDVLAELATSPRAPRSLRQVADLVAADTTKTVRFSDVGRCPTGVLAPDHYLPDGTCAHTEATCPTCGGMGMLLDSDGVEVACVASAPGLPFYTPVCGGTGAWLGARAGRRNARAHEPLSGPGVAGR